MKFAKAFHQESSYSHLKFSYAKTHENYSNVISGNKLNAIVLVAVDDDKPIGMVAAVADSPVFSEDKIATELCWFIHKPYRKSKKAFVLFKAYEEWAKRIGCRFIQSGFLLGSSQANLEEYYLRQGYKPVEMSYMKRI